MSYIKSITTAEAGVNGIVSTNTAKKKREKRRRERLFRDRTHPLEEYDDDLVYKKFRFHRQFIFELAEEVSQDSEFALPRNGPLTPVLQVCLVLRFYATGSFQSVVGEVIGVDQSSACRTITMVTDALMLRVRDWIKMPTQAEANRQKQKFYAMKAIPSVIGCIDSTHPHPRPKPTGT